MTDFNAFPRFVAIVGSRDFPRQHWVVEFVKQLQPDTVVISGGADGVDTWAEEAATACGMRTKIFPIEDWEWKILGKKAGRFRNETLVSYVNQVRGHLVAFVLLDENGQMTNGTSHAIRAASRHHIPTTIFQTYD